MTSIAGNRQTSLSAAANRRIRKYTTRSRDRTTLVNYLTTRNWMPYGNIDVANLARNHSPFLHRMNFMKKLPVHEGCVNTICWNKTGEYLLSGSDDCNLCITKPSYLFDSSKDYTVLHKIPTRHLGNIFSAQFMPNSGDQQIVSCSSEGPVIVHDICSTEPSEGLLNFNCHSSTIYEVVTVPDDDKIFLSCGEDKTVRLFDMRVHSSCARSGTCPHPALTRNSHAMTTLKLHPLNLNLMLIGRADGIGLVYDRRKLPDLTRFSRERAHAERLAGIASQSEYRFKHPLEGVVAQFTVPDMDDRYRFTSLCYNSDGTEVLASYSGDYIYLFSHDRSSNIELIQTLPTKTRDRPSGSTSDDNDGGCSDSTNNVRPTGGQRNRATKISRIRVRGDWSDTGVNSVPHSRQGRDRPESGQATRRPMSLNHIAVTLGTINPAGRPQFVPFTEIIAGPIEYASSSNESNTSENRSARQPERTIEEENEDEEEDADDDDDDENSTVIDEEYNEDYDDEFDAEFERYAEIAVENLIGEAHEACARRGRARNAIQDDDEDMSSVKSSVSSRTGVDSSEPKSGGSQARAKFRKTIDDLKNKYSQIPTHKPRVKYQGHRNSRTSIKKSIFWGDDYIMSGSDCGRIMVWEKATARIVMGFPADERVVNCLAPNPHHYVLASSGIDYDIKLWSTQSLNEAPLKVSEEEMRKIVENNEAMLEESKHTISVPPHLFFRVLESLVQSSR